MATLVASADDEEGFLKVTSATCISHASWSTSSPCLLLIAPCTRAGVLVTSARYRRTTA